MPITVPRFAMIAAVLAAALAPAPSRAQSRLDIPRSFRWYYNYPPEGWRYWARTATGWVERYPDGGENRFQSLSMTDVAPGCSAVRARKLHGPTNEPLTEIAIPTRGCDNHVLLFRFIAADGAPTSEWRKVGDLQAIEY